MDIEGRSLLVDDSEDNREVINEALKKVLKAVFGKVNTDSSGNVLKIGLIRIEPGRNGIGALNCITLTGLDVSIEVLEAMEKLLENLLEAQFYLVTNGAQVMHPREDYKRRLNKLRKKPKEPAPQ